MRYWLMLLVTTAALAQDGDDSVYFYSDQLDKLACGEEYIQLNEQVSPDLLCSNFLFISPECSFVCDPVPVIDSILADTADTGI